MSHEDNINQQVKNGAITVCCSPCAKKYRQQEPYNGTYTTRQSECQICGHTTSVGNASKLFGFHKFI